MSDAQIEELTKNIRQFGVHVKDFKNTQIELQARVLEVEQKMGQGERGSSTLYSDGHLATSTMPSRIANDLMNDEDFRAVKMDRQKSARYVMERPIRAALTNPNRGTEIDTEYPTETQRLADVKGIAAPHLTLMDVLPVLPATSDSVTYVLLDKYVNQVDYQLQEGDEKAKAEISAKLERSDIATLAHWLPASRQVLDDNASLGQLVDRVLSMGLSQKLEYEVLLGAGGEGKIKGLIPQASALTTTILPDGAADRVGVALTELQTTGWNPNVILMNPMDWFTIASERANTGNGQYVLGSPRDPAPPSLWGVPVVLNANVPAGQSLVFDTAMTALLDRQRIVIEASRHNSDNFTKNLVTILAELRAGLAVYAPTALRLVELVPAEV